MAHPEMEEAKVIPGSPEALEVIEAAREAAGKQPTFAGQLFLGNVVTSLIFPYAVQSEEDRRIGDAFCAKLGPSAGTRKKPR